MTVAGSPYLNLPLRTLEEAMLDLNPAKPLPRAVVPILEDGKVCRVTGTVVAQTFEADPRIDIRLDRDPKAIVQVRLAEAEIVAS